MSSTMASCSTSCSAANGAIGRPSLRRAAAAFRSAAAPRRAAVRVEARGSFGGRGGMPMGGPPGMGGGGPGMGGGGTSWDPENLLGAPREGLIQRRMMQKQMEKDREFAAAVTATKDDIRKQVLLRRSQRSPPDAHEELVEYFLNTDAEDMEFEVARCRPRLTPEFFRALDGMIGAARFGTAAGAPGGAKLVSAAAAAAEDEDARRAKSEERLAELELLRQYLEEAAEAVDKAVGATSTAVERMKKLLTAKDKRATIIEMAEANEIDVPLMDLLQQNIERAREAGQEDAAAFMEKVKQAAAKYLLAAAPAAGVAAVPAAPSALAGAGGATTGGGLILPGGASAAKPAAAAQQQQPAEEKKLIL